MTWLRAERADSPGTLVVLVNNRLAEEYAEGAVLIGPVQFTVGIFAHDEGAMFEYAAFWHVTYPVTDPSRTPHDGVG